MARRKSPAAADLAPYFRSLAWLAALFGVAAASNWIAKHLVLHVINRLLDRLRIDDGMPAIIQVARRAATALPVLIVGHGVQLVPHLSAASRSVVAAIADAIWCKEHGLRGGILISAVPPTCDWIAPLHDPVYDPLWKVCEDLQIPVNSHSGTGGPKYPKSPATPPTCWRRCAGCRK